MNELIKIQDYNGKKAVSARELHEFLESKKQFADWINHRIKKYGLIDGIDYQSFSPDSEKGRPAIEYALTLDAAKELSMVEGNAKGKQARKYFIECEKQLKEIFLAPSNMVEMLQASRLLTQSIEAIMAAEKRVQDVETKQIVLEEKVNSMVQSQKTAELELFDIKLSEERPREIPLRAQCRALLNKYCRATGISQEYAWNRLYSDLNYRYGILVKAYTLAKDESRLALAERKGFLDKIYIIVSELVRNIPQSAVSHL